MATLLQGPRTDFSKSPWSASDAESSVAQPPTVRINLVHEIGPDLVGGTIRQEHLVEPSDTPTLVAVDSRVVTDAACRLNSPQYLATVRRRRSTKIKDMFAALAKKARRDDFEVSALKVAEEIRELLVQLTDVQREGNTREILRQIRDTFFDGGHERYRDARARDLVASVFERLAEADEVTPDDVDQVWDELYDSGLSAPIPAVFAVAEENEEADD
jgi:hypothetical protein